MTVVMRIRVHPYKATHFENRKSILHFIAFMVLHKDSHHNCYRPTKFVSKHWYPNDRFSSADKQHGCSLHYFVPSDGGVKDKEGWPNIGILAHMERYISETVQDRS